ncbi:MAG: MBL fold metallo-hydrolase [Candidatus Uhrbacteria bacterium]|nr:MBL fold metallo-hydrolase [Candidatus Uhrbacteria bacterium]
MQISWHGLGSFSIKGKVGQSEVSLVSDPYDTSVGLRFPRTLASAVVVQTSNSPEANNVEAVHGEDSPKPFVISHAGEFEVRGIFVTGISAPKKDGGDHTIYRIYLEGISIALLGSIDRDLTDKEVSKLGSIDILILPIGGGSVLNKEMASDVVSQVEPRLVIPSYYEIEGLKTKLAGVESFCKDLGCPREDSTKLKITKSSLPDEDVNVVVLARS